MTALPTILREYEKLSTNFADYLSIVRERVSPYIEQMRKHIPHAHRAAAEDVPAPQTLELLPSIGQNIFHTVTSGVSTALVGGYSVTLTIINLLLLPFIVFYIAIDFHRLYDTALAIFPASKRRMAAQILAEIDQHVSAFVHGQLIVGAILFCLYSIGLGAVVGVELWFLLAVIAGFGNVVPYIGFLTGLVLSTIMALVTFGDFSHVAGVWAVFGINVMLDSVLITPKIVGGKVGLSPLTIILAIFAGGRLFGLIGVLLAIPGAAVVRVLGHHLHHWTIQRMAAAQ
jgi:predicted PurR-regulated permease PerM